MRKGVALRSLSVSSSDILSETVIWNNSSCKSCIFIQWENFVFIFGLVNFFAPDFSSLISVSSTPTLSCQPLQWRVFGWISLLVTTQRGPIMRNCRGARYASFPYVQLFSPDGKLWTLKVWTVLKSRPVSFFFLVL